MAQPTDESITTTKLPDPLQDITVTVVDAIPGSIDQAVAEGIERIAAFEADGEPNYIVYVTTLMQTMATEGEFCRHTVNGGNANEAAFQVLHDCRLTNHSDTMVVEVFVHSGAEFRFAYRLVEVS